MGDDGDVVIHAAIFGDFLGGKGLMDHAMALPGDDLDLGLGGHKAGQIFIGDHDHFIDAKGFHDLYRVGRGAADVGFRLNLGGGVDVGHHRATRVSFLQGPHVGPGDGSSKGAACVHVRHKDDFFRVQKLRRFGHEMDSGEDDDIGIGFFRHLRQGKGIAAQIADAMENFRRHVVMGQDYRVAFLLERVDGRHIGRVNRPFGFGNDRFDALEH